MRLGRFLPYCAVLMVLIGLCAGCEKKPDEANLKRADLEQQAATIQQSYESLKGVRAELAEARTTLTELQAIPVRRLTDEQKPQIEELNARIPELESTIATGYEDLQTQLSDFLNLALNEFPEAPETGEGLRIYAEEAILNARDIVQKAGDYKKAVEVLEYAKGYYEAVGQTPIQALPDQLAALDELRYMTEERFGLAKNGMTEDEVKEAIGPPYYRNIQEDSARGVITWLYPKRDGGGAAVYFRMKSGKVYGKKFDAVKTRVVKDDEE